MSLNIEDLTRLKVFSASRHLEDARKAPSSMSIITAEEVRKYGWRTLAALRSLRGFYTSDNRRYTYLGVRGSCGREPSADAGFFCGRGRPGSCAAPVWVRTSYRLS